MPKVDFREEVVNVVLAESLEQRTCHSHDEFDALVKQAFGIAEE